MAVIFHKSFSVSTHETKKIVAIFSYFRSSLKSLRPSFHSHGWNYPSHCTALDYLSQQGRVVIGVTLTTPNNDARLLLAFSPLHELLSSNKQTLCGLVSNCLDIILSKSILGLVARMDVFIWLQVNYHKHFNNFSKV